MRGFKDMHVWENKKKEFLEALALYARWMGACRLGGFCFVMARGVLFLVLRFGFGFWGWCLFLGVCSGLGLLFRFGKWWGMGEVMGVNCL